MKINTIIKKKVATSLAKAQEKYADDIASGEMIVEPQTEKSVYSVIWWVFFAIVFVIFFELYVFDAWREAANTCRLFWGIATLYWVILISTAFYTVTMFYIWFVWWQKYQVLKITGYAPDQRRSNPFVKVSKKRSLAIEKYKLMGSTFFIFCFTVLMLHSANAVIVEKTNQKIASYELLKKKSQTMQQNCLAKIK